MSERLVGFGHFMGIFLLLDSGALSVHRVDDFIGELVFHGFLAARAGISCQPPQTEREAAFGPNLDRNLIVGTADAARLNFQLGHNIFQGCLIRFQRILPCFFFHDVKSVVDNFLRNALLEMEPLLGTVLPSFIIINDVIGTRRHKGLRQRFA